MSTPAAVRATDALPLDAHTAQWPVWSTTARLVVTDPAAVAPARGIVEAHLAEVDAACSRFRPDSELMAATALGRPARLSPLLADLVRGALDAARRTDGALDPTVGGALVDLGYDDDLARLPASGVPVRLQVRRVPGWRHVVLDDDLLDVPRGTVLDLGSTAKAMAADAAAARVAARLGVGVLVSIGGDIATAGECDEGWRVLVQDRPDDVPTLVTLPAGSALATSSTRCRQWQLGDQLVHHIIDPRTGLPARRVWRSVSVAAWSCLDANTLTTAAVVKGEAATAWLRELGAPARLVDLDGTVTTLGAWPAEVAA